MKTLKNYILNSISNGKYFFVKDQVLKELIINESQFRFQAYRLSQKGLIKKLTKNFFMIITPEYINFGTIPAIWIIDSLMEYLQCKYYVGLLSAAAFYGATEQQPMVFQVITDKQVKNISLGKIKIEFHVFKYCYISVIDKITVPTGYVKISSKEQTILDLIRFYMVAGYLSNITLIIKNLIEGMSAKNFQLVVQNEKTTTVLQRLGYIFDVLKQYKLAKIVKAELLKRKMEYILFRPDFHKKTGKKVIKWKLILNNLLDLE